MSGYFRMSADEWEPEHYKGRWSPTDKAPRWWAWADTAWHLDRRRLPPVRLLAEQWGWTRTAAYDLSRDVIAAQLEWERRPEEIEYLAGLLTPADKSRTRGAKLAGQIPDNRTPENAGNPPDERTNDGQIPDGSRTDPGHLAGARQTSSSATPPASPSPDSEDRAAPAARPQQAPLIPEIVPASKPPKPPTPKADRATPETPYHLTIAAWTDEHRTVFGTAYPWIFGGRDNDAPRVKSWMSAAQVTEANPAPGIARLRGAFRAYMLAVDAKQTWPKGEPAQTRHFTRDLAKWLQTDPAAPAQTPTSTRADERARTMSALEIALQRAQEREDAQGNDDPPEPPTPRQEHPRPWGADGGRTPGPRG